MSGTSLFMRLFLALLLAVCALRDDIDGTNKTRQATDADAEARRGGVLFTGGINLGAKRHSRFRADSQKYRMAATQPT